MTFIKKDLAEMKTSNCILIAYLLVVSSPCSTQSKLQSNLLRYWYDGISPFQSITRQAKAKKFFM